MKKILRGHRREETARFIAFRSHWRFQSEFCTPEEPHEKGGIENEAGYFRRNHWVPMPKAQDLAELNAQLLAACREDEQRQIAGHTQPVGAAMIEERAHLLPLTEQGFELMEVYFPRVDGLGCVRVRTNLYSVPAKPGRTVEVRLYPSYVEIRDEGRCIAPPRALLRTAAAGARFGALPRRAGAKAGGAYRIEDRSQRGAHAVYGRRITTGCSTH